MMTWSTEWAIDLRDPAMRCLNPNRELQNTMKRGREVAIEIFEIIDRKLSLEGPEVEKSVLFSLSDQVNGRIANL